MLTLSPSKLACGGHKYTPPEQRAPRAPNAAGSPQRTPVWAGSKLPNEKWQQAATRQRVPQRENAYALECVSLLAVDTSTLPLNNEHPRAPNAADHHNVCRCGRGASSPIKSLLEPIKFVSIRVHSWFNVLVAAKGRSLFLPLSCQTPPKTKIGPAPKNRPDELSQRCKLIVPGAGGARRTWWSGSACHRCWG